MQRKLQNTFSRVIICIITLALLGFTFPEPPQKERVVWPLPPDPPKITYIMSLERPKDIGIKKSLFRRFVEIFTGTEPEPQILRPTGVISDGKGTVYVTDTSLHVVHVFYF